MTKAVSDTLRRRAGGSARPLRRAPAFALVLGLASGLAGCGGSAAVSTFDLSAVSYSQPVRSPRGQVVVTEPLTLSPADSDRIVIRPTPDTVATLKGAQWVERLPRLVQARLIQSFENGHVLRAVTGPGARVSAQFELSTEIRRFEIDVTQGQAVVEFSVKLIGQSGGRIKAAQIFSASVPASAASGEAASHALDQAMGEVLRRIVAWTASQV